VLPKRSGGRRSSVRNMKRHDPQCHSSRVTLRLDRVWDSSSLYELAELEGRRLREERHVVAEVDGRVVAALPLGGGAPLAEPLVPTADLLPLLELRAAQIRRVELQLSRIQPLRLRLWLGRA